jgi:hypothetical protein
MMTGNNIQVLDVIWEYILFPKQSPSFVFMGDNKVWHYLFETNLGNQGQMTVYMIMDYDIESTFVLKSGYFDRMDAVVPFLIHETKEERECREMKEWNLLYPSVLMEYFYDLCLGRVVETSSGELEENDETRMKILRTYNPNRRRL